MDTDYLLLGYEVLDQGGGHRRKYGGSTGWLLAHNKEKDEWQLQGPSCKAGNASFLG